MEAKDIFGNTTLHRASNKGNWEIVKLLIENGVNVEAKNNSAMTALHVACDRGHLEVVKVLLRLGAKLTAKTTNGFRPLDFACMGNHFELVWFCVSQYLRLVVEDNQVQDAHQTNYASRSNDFDFVGIIIMDTYECAALSQYFD